MTRYRLPSRQPFTGDFAFYTLRQGNPRLTAPDDPSYARIIAGKSLPHWRQSWPGACLSRRVLSRGTVAVLISDSHAFIFVHMRKVASTSMQSILRPLCLEPPAGRLAHLKSRARLEWDYRRYQFRTHDDILAAKRRMPAEKFQRYFKFAFVRNPWSRLFSEYEYILSQPGHGRHARVARLGSFSEFIRMQIPRREAYQLNMLCDSGGGLLTDFVGRLENLQADWQVVCERIGIRCESLPSRNVTQHGDYRMYFSDQDVQLVAKHWAREIELFEYSFDAG